MGQVVNQHWFFLYRAVRRTHTVSLGTPPRGDNAMDLGVDKVNGGSVIQRKSWGDLSIEQKLMVRGTALDRESSAAKRNDLPSCVWHCSCLRLACTGLHTPPNSQVS